MRKWSRKKGKSRSEGKEGERREGGGVKGRRGSEEEGGGVKGRREREGKEEE